MGKITSALKKAAEERMQRIEKISRIKEETHHIIKKIGDSKVDSRLVTYFDPKALITEQYKVLRTNFLSLNRGKPPRVVVITSALHSEGKTITALNLAIAMAQTVSKPKILLIDADMRRGRISRYLGIDHPVGLTEYLSGKAGLEEVLFHIDLENLTFMSSGSVPHNPSELCGSANMRTLLNEVKERFDYIFIDTPPIIAVTDSGIVGSQTDGVVMVVQAGRTQRGIVDHATELLEQSHAKLVGHVLTNIEYHLPEYIYRYL